MTDVKISDMALVTALQAGDCFELYRPGAPTSELRGEIPVRTYQAITAAGAQGTFQIARTSGFIRAELTQDLTAAGFFLLPSSPQEGDLVEVLRNGGGFFDFTNNATGTILGYRQDFASFLWTGGAWHRVELKGRTGARREGTGRALTISDNGVTIAATAAASFNVPLAVGQSTGWLCDLVQAGSGTVDVTLDPGLIRVGVSAANTSAPGQSLRLRAIGNSEVLIQRNMDSEAPDGVAGWNANGGFARLVLGGTLQVADGVLADAGGPAQPQSIVATGAANPNWLDATNRVSDNKALVANDGTNTVLIEIANVPAYSEWAVYRGKLHTGPVHFLGAPGLVVEGKAGVGATATGSATWGPPSGFDVTISGTGLLALAAGTPFFVDDPTAVANSGYYMTTAQTSTTAMACTKVSGLVPIFDATPRSVTLTERPICATMAPGRASLAVIIAETGDCRLEGQDTSPKVLDNDLDLNSHVLSGLGKFTGTAEFNTVVPASVEWGTAPALPQTLGPQHNGQVITLVASGTVLVPTANVLIPDPGKQFICGFVLTGSVVAPGVTFDGPSATNQVAVAGEMVVITVRKDGTIRFVKAATVAL